TMDFLIVDDERSIRDAATMLIEDEGHYAEAVSDSEGAFASLREEKFDAVLLDLHLGGEDGLEVLDRIVKQYPAIPVVVFTAPGSRRFHRKAVRARSFPRRGGAGGGAAADGQAHRGAGTRGEGGPAAEWCRAAV